MRTQGFTLVELMISMAILVVVTGLGLVALQSSTTSIAVAKAKGDVQRSVREIMTALTRELQLASKRSDDSLTPPLLPLAVNATPASGSPVEVEFQVPVDGSGRNWSNRIRFRYVNEDANGNGRMDGEEDLDSDGVLARRIVRIQDRNGDGDTADTGEVTPVGAVNDLSNVQFTLNGDVLDITVTATKLVGVRRTNPVTARATGSIYLLN
jgi:prepilin-type N-terminal cleavage/methylation domain-containing protein